MMEFLKEQKKIFTTIDKDKSGNLDLNELATALAASGLPMPAEQAIQLGRQFDADNSGALEFDEFLQMMVQYTQVAPLQGQWSGFAQQRATAEDLQMLFP